MWRHSARKLVGLVPWLQVRRDCRHQRGCRAAARARVEDGNVVAPRQNFVFVRSGAGGILTTSIGRGAAGPARTHAGAQTGRATALSRLAGCPGASGAILAPLHEYSGSCIVAVQQNPGLRRFASLANVRLTTARRLLSWGRPELTETQI